MNRGGLIHGHARDSGATDTYSTWENMVSRCHNPNNPYFQKYGGRGIEVCDRWRTFENFLADMGDRPSRLYSIDRVDNDSGYEPGNCRWATKKEQQRNRRACNYVEVQGRRMCMQEAVEVTGLSATTLLKRQRAGEQLDAPRCTAPALARARRVRVNGEDLTIPAAAKKLGLSVNAARGRIAKTGTLDSPPILNVQVAGEWLTADAAAERLGKHHMTVRRWAAAGKLPSRTEQTCPT